MSRILQIVLIAGALTAVSCTVPAATGPGPDPTPAHDIEVACEVDETCEATASTPDSTLVVETPAGSAGVITIDVNDGSPLDCSGYEEINPDTYTVDVTAPDRPKSVSIVIPAALVPDEPFAELQIFACFGSPTPFTAFDPAGIEGDPLWWLSWFIPGLATMDAEVIDGEYVGLLPRCYDGPFAPEVSVPCVSERSVDEDGNVTLVTKAAPGDPRYR
jgi:hypothetical protein